MTCKKPEFSFSSLTPCERVKVLEDAVFQLVSGKQKARVRQGDNEMEFQKPALGLLEKELARARAECAAANGDRRAITIGRTGGWPRRMKC